MAFCQTIAHSRNELGNWVEFKDLFASRQGPSTACRGASCCDTKVGRKHHIVAKFWQDVQPNIRCPKMTYCRFDWRLSWMGLGGDGDGVAVGMRWGWAVGDWECLLFAI